MLSREWRCSWSSADRRCSNYIWVIDNFFAYQGATYIRGFTVSVFCFITRHQDGVCSWKPSAWKTGIQYHGCWWPGDARSQGISSNDNEYSVLIYYVYVRKLCHHSLAWWYTDTCTQICPILYSVTSLMACTYKCNINKCNIIFVIVSHVQPRPIYWNLLYIYLSHVSVLYTRLCNNSL